MTLSIDWTTDPAAELFDTAPRSTILQHKAYGLAMRDYMGQEPRMGVIRRGGAAIGLFQILEMKALKGFLHTASLDRGPLWIEGHGSETDWADFLQALRKDYPRRFGRVVRLMPETDALPDAGFRRKKLPGYQTIWVDLQKPEDELRAGLDKKWRNALSKAERSDIEVVEDNKGTFLPWLLKVYALDKTIRAYEGASPELIQLLYKHGMKFLIVKAQHEGRDIAAQLFALHGRSATYQIGWSGPEGREVNAHNLLLWKAVAALKNRGIKELDLGGINDEAKGLSDFKKGLGGVPVTLAGVYT